MCINQSINQFLVEAADAYISRLEGSDLTYEDVPKKEEVRYITNLNSIRFGIHG